MAEKDKAFAVERRGGYPWSDGYVNRNDDAALPAPLSGNERELELPLRIGDRPAGGGRLTVRCILFGASKGDEFEIRLNGVRLRVIVNDHAWKDAQIFSPRPQPTSGGKGQYRINPKQRLLRIECPVPSQGWQVGANRIEIRIAKSDDAAPDRTVYLEKVEGWLRYA
jgi:hypothetical protein